MQNKLRDVIIGLRRMDKRISYLKPSREAPKIIVVEEMTKKRLNKKSLITCESIKHPTSQSYIRTLGVTIDY